MTAFQSDYDSISPFRLVAPTCNNSIRISRENLDEGRWVDVLLKNSSHKWTGILSTVVPLERLPEQQETQTVRSRNSPWASDLQDKYLRISLDNKIYETLFYRAFHIPRLEKKTGFLFCFFVFCIDQHFFQVTSGNFVITNGLAWKTIQ